MPVRIERRVGALATSNGWGALARRSGKPGASGTLVLFPPTKEPAVRRQGQCHPEEPLEDEQRRQHLFPRTGRHPGWGK